MTDTPKRKRGRPSTGYDKKKADRERIAAKRAAIREASKAKSIGIKTEKKPKE